MEKELNGMWSLVGRGELLPIKEWLSERIYKYGKLRTPSELVLSVTGKPLDPQYLVDYLTKKYTDIYRL
jgi:carboxypeptidase Taq